MTTTDAGYLTDLEYTGHFYPFLAPAELAYAAVINGYRAPSVERFTWCELGCGKGMTPLVLAALHPGGEFHACDLNPAHIAYGEGLRRAAGLDNLHLHARSVGQMVAAGLPRVDYIVMHGLYGWVPPAVREEIHAFLHRFLRPGGLVFVSYNALPGWAPLEPLRRMIGLLAQAHPGGSAEKAQWALARLKHLAERGAAYFQENPAAAAHLAELDERDLRYLAHEYLTPHGTAFHFADVARAMGQAGLAYAGSTTPRQNYVELMAPERFDGVLASARSRLELETLRDFIVGTRFRRDVFAAQPESPAGNEPVSLAAWRGLAFRLTDLPEKLPLAAGAQDAVAFDFVPRRAAVAALHELLARGPAHADALHVASGHADETDSAALIQKLVVAGHLAPCPPQSAAPGWPRLNSALVQAALIEGLPEIALAAPALGTGRRCETAHAAALEAALVQPTAEAAAGAVLARLQTTGRHPQQCTESGQVQALGEEEITAHVAELWRTLRDPESDGARLLRLYGLTIRGPGGI